MQFPKENKSRKKTKNKKNPPLKKQVIDAKEKSSAESTADPIFLSKEISTEISAVKKKFQVIEGLLKINKPGIEKTYHSIKEAIDEQSIKISRLSKLLDKVFSQNTEAYKVFKQNLSELQCQEDELVFLLTGEVESYCKKNIKMKNFHDALLVIVPEYEKSTKNLNQEAELLFPEYDFSIYILLAEVLCATIKENGIEKAVAELKDCKLTGFPSADPFENKEQVIDFIKNLLSIVVSHSSYSEDDPNLCSIHKIAAELTAYTGHIYLGRGLNVETPFRVSLESLFKYLKSLGSDKEYTNSNIIGYIESIYKYYSNEPDEKLRKSPIEIYLDQPEFDSLKKSLPEIKTRRSDCALDEDRGLDPRRNGAIFQLKNIIMASAQLKSTKDHKVTPILKIATQNIQAYLSRRAEEIDNTQTEKEYPHKLNADLEEIDRFSHLLCECYSQLDSTDKNELFGGATLIHSDEKPNGCNLFINLTESYLEAGKFDEALKYYRNHQKLKALEPKDSKQAVIYDLNEEISALKSIQDKYTIVKNNIAQLTAHELAEDAIKFKIEATKSLLDDTEKQISLVKNLLEESDQHKDLPLYTKIQRTLAGYDKYLQNFITTLLDIQNSPSHFEKNPSLSSLEDKKTYNSLTTDLLLSEIQPFYSLPPAKDRTEEFIERKTHTKIDSENIEINNLKNQILNIRADKEEIRKKIENLFNDWETGNQPITALRKEAIRIEENRKKIQFVKNSLTQTIPEKTNQDYIP